MVVTATRTAGETAAALVVEDERAIPEFRVRRLDAAHTVRAASGGREAMAGLDRSDRRVRSVGRVR